MKRYTERIRENEYATSNAIIEELNIDVNNEDKYYILEQQKNIINTLNNKLGELEDLEEQLGCSLDVVFKALTNGIYIKNIDGEMVNFKCRLTYKNEELGWYFNIINGYVLTKDYKKTWWLKEDKSE